MVPDCEGLHERSHPILGLDTPARAALEGRRRGDRCHTGGGPTRPDGATAWMKQGAPPGRRSPPSLQVASPGLPTPAFPPVSHPSMGSLAHWWCLWVPPTPDVVTQYAHIAISFWCRLRIRLWFLRCSAMMFLAFGSLTNTVAGSMTNDGTACSRATQHVPGPHSEPGPSRWIKHA